jgi:hypothetical protein
MKDVGTSLLTLVAYICAEIYVTAEVLLKRLQMNFTYIDTSVPSFTITTKIRYMALCDILLHAFFERSDQNEALWGGHVCCTSFRMFHPRNYSTDFGDTCYWCPQ